MTDDSPPRFVVRQGAIKNTWMVWDRQFRGPARIPGGYAIKLSEERARQIRDQLMLDETYRG
jgi:hypothetical protein